MCRNEALVQRNLSLTDQLTRLSAENRVIRADIETLTQQLADQTRLVGDLSDEWEARERVCRILLHHKGTTGCRPTLGDYAQDQPTNWQLQEHKIANDYRILKIKWRKMITKFLEFKRFLTNVRLHSTYCADFEGKPCVLWPLAFPKASHERRFVQN